MSAQHVLSYHLYKTSHGVECRGGEESDFTVIIPTYASHSLCVALHTRLVGPDPVFAKGCGSGVWFKGFGARFGSGSDFTVESDPVFLVELVPDPYFSRVSKPDPYFFEFRICIVVERRIYIQF